MRPAGLQARTRPAFFDLYRIRQPVTAVVSIGHRVSGVLLAAAVPVTVYLLQLSLSDPQGYAQVAAWFHHPWFRVIMVIAVWAFAHHLLAGVRHLLFDLHLGTRLRQSRAGAWIVLSAEAVLVLLAVAGMS